jgi:nicotinamidase-related amidase
MAWVLRSMRSNPRRNFRFRADMAADPTLREEPIGSNAVHICVDMQAMFREPSQWSLPWMDRVLPRIVDLCSTQPSRLVFTRFVPARRPGAGQGTWKRYYERWADMTLERLGPGKVDLVPELRAFTPPAPVVDKPVYSPWLGSSLRTLLAQRRCDTVIVTGGETDMCVLSTVLGAADYGLRTIVVQDAVCSASDEAHDAMIGLFSNRYGQHIETATTEQLVNCWIGG